MGIIVRGKTIFGRQNIFEPELTTYMSGLNVPLSSIQKTSLNTFALDIKSGYNINNFTEVFDAMYILGGETSESSLRNFVKRAHDATAVNSPTFTQYQGFVGNGTSSYIDTNYKGTNGVNYTLNSASFGLYARTTRISEAKYNGASDASGRILIYPFYGGLTCYLNSTTAVVDNTISGTLGFSIGTRNSSTAVKTFRNITIKEGSSISTGIPNYNIFISARNLVGAASNWDTIEFAFAFAGRGLSDSEVTILENAFEKYMDSHGKGVL